MNLINRGMDITEVTVSTVMTYLKICDVIIHCDRFRPRA